LVSLGSPFASDDLAAAKMSGSKGRLHRAWRRAMRGLTPEQLAEFQYVCHYPADVSRRLLAKGRPELTKAAMAYATSLIRLVDLEFIAAHAADLIRPDGAPGEPPNIAR
jgi:hypothetical protein